MEKRKIMVILVFLLFLISILKAQYYQLWEVGELYWSFVDFKNTDLDPSKEIIYYYEHSIAVVDATTGIIEWDITWHDIDEISIKLIDIDADGCYEIHFRGHETYNDPKMCHLYKHTGTATDPEPEPSTLNNYKEVLYNNYPNPFNPNTTIKYSIPQKSNVTLKIYNAKGQLVKTLVNNKQEKGEYQIIWDGIDNNGKKVSSGVYFYQLKAGDFIASKKMITIK
jgi:hypothetical protein